MWLAKMGEAVRRGLSRYKEPLPLVVMCHADHRLVADCAALTSDGQQQLAAAAEKLRARYPVSSRYIVYAVGGDAKGRLVVSARRMAQLLKAEYVAKLGRHPYNIFHELGGSKIIPVLVTNQPMVQRLVLEAYQDAVTEVDGTAPPGIPYFLTLVVAKRPDVTLVPYRLTPDSL